MNSKHAVQNATIFYNKVSILLRKMSITHPKLTCWYCGVGWRGLRLSLLNMFANSRGVALAWLDWGPPCPGTFILFSAYRQAKCKLHSQKTNHIQPKKNCQVKTHVPTLNEFIRNKIRSNNLHQRVLTMHKLYKHRHMMTLRYIQIQNLNAHTNKLIPKKTLIQNMYTTY